MERSEISRIAHRGHPIAAPVTAANMHDLLARLQPIGAGGALDLGCGRGEWLLGLPELNPAATGVGVDIALPPKAATSAHDRGLADRVQWVRAGAARWDRSVFDVVVCIGASQAFGGLDGALRALRRWLAPGGQVLFGDGFWEVPPSPAAQEALSADANSLPDLAGLRTTVGEHGFVPSFGHISTTAEWDDYEWSWTGSLTTWALRESTDDGDRRQALEMAQAHRDGWAAGYRRELGFATIVLNDVGTDRAEGTA